MWWWEKNLKYISKLLRTPQKCLENILHSPAEPLKRIKKTTFAHSTEKLCVCLQNLHAALKKTCICLKILALHREFLHFLKRWFTFHQKKICIHSKKCLRLPRNFVCSQNIFVPLRNFVFTWKTLKIPLCPSNKLSMCLKMFVFPKKLWVHSQNVCVPTKNFGFVGKKPLRSPKKHCVHSQNVCVPQETSYSTEKCSRSPKNFAFIHKTIHSLANLLRSISKPLHSPYFALHKQFLRMYFFL